MFSIFTYVAHTVSLGYLCCNLDIFVGIHIKQITEHYMAACGYEFYLIKLLLSALEDKIRVPALPGNWKVLSNDTATATKISSHHINSRYFNRFVTISTYIM